MKSLKNTENYFTFGKDSPEKKIKDLRIDFSKEYKNASGDSKKLLECIKKSRKNIKNLNQQFKEAPYTYGSEIWKTRKKFLKELDEKFNKLEKELPKDSDTVLVSGELEDVNQIRGMEVFRTIISHGVGALESLIQMKYEIIVVLNGDALGNKANNIVRTQKGKTCKVSDINIKPPNLSSLPILGKSINEKLKKFNVVVCVYITFLNSLSKIAVSALNIKNELDVGLIDEIGKT